MLYPATHYRIKNVALGEHINLTTKDVTPIVDVFVDRIWGVATESLDRYYSQDALSVAYQNHLHRPYKNMSIDEQTRDDIYRSNHALAHHVRVTRNIDYVVDYFAAHAKPNSMLQVFCQNLSILDREKLRIFMAFSRTGRESENDFISNPEEYKTELKASADHFKSFILSRNLMTNEEVDLWCRVLQDMGNPLFNFGIDEGLRKDLNAYDEKLTPEQKQTAKNLHEIFNLAHKLDLPRCFSKENYQHAVLPYKPMSEDAFPNTNNSQKSEKNKLIPYTKEAQAAFEAMERFAQGCIIATGERMAHWNISTQQSENFLKSNTNILYCWDICDSVALENEISVTVKPFFDKLDKVFLNPAIFHLYQEITKLGITDFPADEDEVNEFLTSCFNSTLSTEIKKEDFFSFFKNADLLIYIFESEKISDENKKNVFLSTDYKKIYFDSLSKFSDLVRCRWLTDVYSNIIFKAQIGRWEDLTKSAEDLVELLNAQEFEDKHDEIIKAQKMRWKELVNNLRDLAILLECDQLKIEHHNIIKEQSGQWAKLIKTVDHIVTLFDYKENLFNLQTWQKIVNELKGKLNYHSFLNHYVLMKFLKNPKLKDLHQEMINAHEGEWKNLITLPCDLVDLLSCIKSKKLQLPIIQELKEEWRNLVGNEHMLCVLLESPTLKDQHKEIIQAQKSNSKIILGNLIFNSLKIMKKWEINLHFLEIINTMIELFTGEISLKTGNSNSFFTYQGSNPNGKTMIALLILKLLATEEIKPSEKKNEKNLIIIKKTYEEILDCNNINECICVIEKDWGFDDESHEESFSRKIDVIKNGIKVRENYQTLQEKIFSTDGFNANLHVKR